MNLIDISAHQGEIDWGTVKGKVDGVIIRAGYGAGNVDKYFRRNIAECNRLGIPAGVYWFSYAVSPETAEAEARACLDVIAPYRVELPVAFDWEYDSENRCRAVGVNVTADLCNAMSKAFCGAVERAGYYAMIYTNPDMKRRYFTDCGAYDLWLASWGVPEMPDCGIWQYGLTSVDGISGRVDGNHTKRDYPTLIRSAGLNHLDGKQSNTADRFGPVIAWAEENGIAKERPLTLIDLIYILEMMEENAK